MAESTLDSSAGLLSVKTVFDSCKTDDQVTSENNLLLVPQWLYAKPTKTKTELLNIPKDMHTTNFGNSNDPVQKKDRLSDGFLDKKEWGKAAPGIENSRRWQEEERETGLLGRRDCRKEDRHADNVSGRESAESRGLTSSDQWNNVENRSSRVEMRQQSKWLSGWGPEDKERDSWTEKRMETNKEDSQSEKQIVGSSNCLSTEPKTDKWRPCHRLEVHSSGSPVYRAAPGSGTERGLPESLKAGFAAERGRGRPSSTGLIGAVSLYKSDHLLGKSGSCTDKIRYSRQELLDIYRKERHTLSFDTTPEGMEEVLPITHSNSIVPLAFVAPNEEEVIFARWQGLISAFDFEIKYIKGADNSLADFLSLSRVSSKMSSSQNSSPKQVLPAKPQTKANYAKKPSASASPSPTPLSYALQLSQKFSTLGQITESGSSMTSFPKPNQTPLPYINKTYFDYICMVEPYLYALISEPQSIARNLFSPDQQFEEADTSKTREFYEFILVDSDSVIITHHYDDDQKSRITFSKCQILKILTEADWGQVPRYHKKFSQNFIPQTYNYLDYKNAWLRAFLVNSQNSGHSWFFLFCKKFNQKSLPFWFQHIWWSFFGPVLDILPPTVKEGWNVFKEKYQPPIPVTEQVLSVWFFIRFNLVWIMCWDYICSHLDSSLSLSKNKPQWFCRRTKVKWWQRFDHSKVTKEGVLAFFSNKEVSHTPLPQTFPLPETSSVKLLKQQIRKHILAKPTKAQLMETLFQICSDEADDPAVDLNEDDCFNIFDPRDP